MNEYSPMATNASALGDRSNADMHRLFATPAKKAWGASLAFVVIGPAQQSELLGIKGRQDVLCDTGRAVFAMLVNHVGDRIFGNRIWGKVVLGIGNGDRKSMHVYHLLKKRGVNI
jgi:hypothetical protein